MTLSTDELARAMAEAWRAGRPEQVLALAAHVSGAIEDDEGVLLLLGMAQQQTGHATQAAATFEHLSRMRPGVSAYWNNLGVARRKSGDLAASEHALARAVSLAPADAEARYNLGLVYLEQQRWPQARLVLLEAVELAPAFIDARLQAGWACYRCGDADGQRRMLAGAADWPAQPARQALVLATMLGAQGDVEAALRALAQARVSAGSAAEAMQARLRAQRAALYERNNQLAEATRELQSLPLGALEALPPDADEARIDGWRAHAALAMREGRHAEAAALYARVLAVATDDDVCASAGFALAVARDRAGRYQDAWQALQAAHAAQLGFARNVVPELLEADGQPLPLTAPSPGGCDTWTRLRSPPARSSPVFIIGFPRSGTTLLEQMLDAHPEFRSMDERAFIHELIERMQGAGQRYPADLPGLGQADADQLREVYRRMAARVLPDRGPRRLVDKNPLNMLCLPMIVRLFPDARIILCLRHPCDVLLSCYMQPFRSPAFMVLCSSLPRLARGYAQAFEQCCRDLDALAPHVLEWRYESVVAGFAAQAARLGTFLGIEDAAPMARFDQHARARHFIGTPSYAQVTEPLHRRAVGRWQAYREHFEPVLPVLRPWIERWGYRV